MKVLVIRFSSIGDIVLTSPVLRCLKLQRPDVEIHYLTKRGFADLVAQSPYVHRVHTLDERIDTVLPTLKAERFDAVIDLHHNLRTWKVKRALGVPAFSFEKMNVPKWVLVNLGTGIETGAVTFKWRMRHWVKEAVERLGERHIVDRYLRTVEHLGVKNDGQGLDLFIPPSREVDMGTLPESHRHGYTALCIGAAHATKRLPRHRLIDLARAIHGPVLIIGGEEDREMGRTIGHAIGPRVCDVTGHYDLLGSASLIRQANAAIVHDSGAMHMACAFRKHTVSVWGNTVPLFGMGPYIPLHPERARVVEVSGLDCRPCSKIGFDRCPKGHFRCMEDQDVAAIAGLAKRID